MENMISQTFIMFDPNFAAHTSTPMALMLGFIRYRTRQHTAIEDGNLRWAHVSMTDIAHAANVSKRTAKRLFAEALKSGLVKTTPDSSDSTGRLVACCQEVVEQAAPGCWLAAQLQDDMSKSSTKKTIENPAKNKKEANEKRSSGGVTVSPGGVSPCHRGGCHRVTGGGVTVSPPPVTKCHPDTTSDLRFSDQDHPFVPTIKKIEKKERKKEEEKEKEIMEQIYIALLQDYVEPEPYVPVATNLNSVAVDMDADSTPSGSGSLTAPTLDTEPDTAEVGIKAIATSALSGVNSETKNDTAAFAGFVAGIAANLTAKSKPTAMQRQTPARPSPADVNAYLAGCGAWDAGFDGHAFCADMDARGWTAEDGSPIRNWQMAVTQRVLMARVGQMPAYQAQAA